MPTTRPPRPAFTVRSGAVVGHGLVAGVLVAALAACTTSAPGTPAASSSPAPAAQPSARPSVQPSAQPSVPPSAQPPVTGPTTPVPRPVPTRTTRTDRALPYRASIARIDDALAQRMHASWRPGCPVPLEKLRYVRVRHVDFEGRVRDGELVVHADVARGVVRVFERLYAIGYPVRSLRLVDDFGADDDASMAADNTSAFNCRAVTGGTAWSQHSYGRAIDVNPVENPYVNGSSVAPDAGRAFLDRAPAPGVVLADDQVVRAFAAEGWYWGGYWTGPVDYQHFSTANR